MDIPAKLGVPDREFRVVIGSTRVDYDPDKEEVNRKKHGYSLASAVYMLEQLLLPSANPKPRATSDGFVENGEVRHMHLCVDDCGDVVLMVTTMRPNETVKVISFRRAHEDERKRFKELTGYAKE